MLILLTPRIWQWMLSGGNSGWNFLDEAGNPTSYVKTVFFPGDVAFALFNIALIVEGAILLIRRTRQMLATALVITALATAANLIYTVYMMQKGYGFQLYSGLATAFGLYILTYQWSLLGRRSLV